MKFKVGDRVEISKDIEYKDLPLYEGKVFIISEIYEGDEFPYELSELVCVSEDEIRLAE